MFRWLSRRQGNRQAPLTGAPRHQRRKTYSADSGYVYQYLYQGYRVALETRGNATEYVFDVSAGREASFPVSVFVADDATGAWERRRNRELNSTERYAIAKMALFGAFDEREGSHAMRVAVWVGEELLEKTLETLGID